MHKNHIKDYVIIVGIVLLISFIVNSFSCYFVLGRVNVSAFIELHSKFPLYYMFDVFFLVVLPVGVFMIFRYLYSSVEQHEISSIRNLERLNSNINLTQKLIENQLNFQKEIEEEDVLGKFLIQLRDRLKNNIAEENERKQEDIRRSWATEGLARFADILRQNNNNDLSELGYNVISNLIKYLGANQGGFFVLKKAQKKDEKDYFELNGCYAYEKRKVRNKIIEYGEGLVGRCGIERETIYMTDIPKDYIQITSGLGQDTPTSLILVPLISNDNLQGVIELASFKEFEQYQIEFIESVSEIVASTIAGVKINIQTAKLLEESRAQGAKLSRQEEEMRRNMEEMKLLQKEAAMQSEEFISFSNSVNHTMIRADFNVEGTLLYANTKFLNKLGYVSNSEVEGQSIFKFINPKDHEWFNKIWSNLSKGGRHYEGFMKQMTKDGKDLWTLSTYTCVRDDNKKVVKVLFLAIDTTEFKKQSIQYEGMISALNRSIIRAEFAIGGEVLDCNTNYLNVLDLSSEEIVKFTIFDLVDISESKKIRKSWRQVTKNIAFDETLKYISKEGKEVWLAGAFTAVKDMYGEISSVIFIGHNVTEQVVAEKQIERQNSILLEQEKQLQENQLILEHKLNEATEDMRSQFKTIEKIKILNEKTLEGALDGIFTFNKNGDITFFNRAAQLLWKYSSDEVIGYNVSKLFSKAIIESNDFVNSIVSNDKEKIVGARQEILITDKDKVDKNVLILLSEASFENDHTYTAFVQNIEVELF